jgi:hypothetical protein
MLGTEVPFSCEINLGSDRVHLTGSADRPSGFNGRIRIVDFKTSKTALTAADIALHDQLGVYQLAVQHVPSRWRGRVPGQPALNWSISGFRTGDGHPKTFSRPRSTMFLFQSSCQMARTRQFRSSTQCIAGSPRRHRSFGANITTHGSEPAAVAVPSEQSPGAAGLSAGNHMSTTCAAGIRLVSTAPPTD